jgi:DNA primase
VIPQSFIQDLLSRVDIVEVVGAAVPLKRAGTNLAACCPFHNEKSPSFTVSPTKQFYHCFGCGAHGTAISFLMEYHGMGFIDAVKDLAARAGMTVPEEERTAARSEAEARAPALTEVLARAARFYKEQLKRSEKAVAYLKGRGLTGEIAARFMLGYAPDGWQNLGAIFGDYDAPELVEAGLVIRNEEGRRYDRFRDRIMFPIVNPRGDIVGFGGRVLGAGEPKYLNSPETPVFEKGRELYGLFQARRPIRADNCVIVVEGYMDVVALAQSGVGNAVATLGTATTPTHVQKLLRQADRVVFCFDGDAAGRRAGWRALEVSLQALVDGKQVGFLFLPDPEDPDSYVRKHGSDAFRALVDGAEPLSRTLIRELASRVDMDTPEGKAAFLKEAEVLVKQIAAPNLGRTMRIAVAREAGMPVPEQRGAPPSRAPGAASAPPRRSPADGLEESVLRALVAQPALLPLVREAVALAPAGGRWDLIRELAEGIGAGSLAASPAAIFQHLEDSGRSAVAVALQKTLLDFGDAHDFESDLRGTITRLDQKMRRARREALVNGVRTVGDLSVEARAIMSDARRT